MLKIVIMGYSNCDKLPVCRVQNLGNTAFFGGKHLVFLGKQMNGLGNMLLILGKHLPWFWLLILHLEQAEYA